MLADEPAKKAAAKKTAAKKTAAKKTAAKKTAAKKTAAKKTAAKKTAAKKTAAKDAPRRKNLGKDARAKGVTGPRSARTADPEDAIRSRAWKRSLEKATGVVRDNRRLRALVERAGDQSDREKLGRVAQLLDDVKALIRLVRAYAKGDYRDISFDNLVLIVAGLIYFVSPIDLIPDFIGPLGFADDAVVLRFVLSMVSEEVAKFREWEGT